MGIGAGRAERFQTLLFALRQHNPKRPADIGAYRNERPRIKVRYGFESLPVFPRESNGHP